MHFVHRPRQLSPVLDRRVVRRILALAFLFPAGGSLACDAPMDVKVVLRDTKGNPLEGATVQLVEPYKPPLVASEKSDSQGLAQLTSVFGWRSRPHLLRIEREGFRTFAVSLEVRRGYSCQITLVPNSEQEPSSGACRAT